MDKQSGVYLVINDNSFQTGGAANIKPIIAMLTTKGKSGLNYVTAATYKDVVGYDLKYNSNYYGLGKLLEKVSYAYVWRLNQGAKLANAYFMTSTSDKESMVDAEVFEDITAMDPKPIFAVANKTVGNPGTTAIKFTPTPNTSSIANEGATPTTPQTITLEDVSSTESKELYDSEIKSGCILYDSTNSNVVAIIKKNYDDELRVYKVVDGEIVDDVISVDEYNIWTDGTNFYNGSMELTEEPVGVAGEPNVIGTVRNTNYNVIDDRWNIGDKYYDSSFEEVTPEGTQGSATNICDIYVADGSEEFLTPGKWYATDNAGTNFYQIRQLGTTWASTVSVEITNGTDAFNELSALYTATPSKFQELKYYPYTRSVPTGNYTKINNSWYKVFSFTSVMFVTSGTPEENTDITDALDSATDITINHVIYTHEYIGQINAIGSAEWTEDTLTMVLVAQPSKDSYYTARTIPVSIKNWTVAISDYADNQYKIKQEVNISTDTESEIYWKKLDFGDVQFDITGDIPSNWQAIRNYLTLDNGSNGLNNIVASDIDLKPLETSGCNILAMNGITNHKIVNKIAAKAENYFTHTFADAPAYSLYTDVENWEKNIYRSEYLATAGRPDEVEIDANGTKIYVYPSVNYVCILADMISNYGSLCFPPAGVTYGQISVESLMDCDYENFGNELKTNRINWQRSTSNGTVMWEQRTTYALNTDLSYIAPVFIIDEIRDQVITFEEQFNFRYATPTDLLNQYSGLNKILSDLQTKGFVYSYDVNVPSFAEAQAAGRTLKIMINVAITKDSEVIEIELNLVNG